MNKYEIIRLIGDGTYGIVYEGKNKETKEKVAIKKLKQKYKSIEECKNKIEIQVLEQLNHENIIQLKEVIREYNGEVSYIFEYCDCNLLEFIDAHRGNNKKIPEIIIKDIILQLTRGLNYLHSKGYLHRDLKPENILLILNKYDLYSISKNDINNSNIKVKIADFGTVKKIPTQNELSITEYVCTRWYRAPECVLRTDYYNETSDIWAIGCIMAELYTLEPIFPGENEFDQINQIFKILGTPTESKWSWGYLQAKNLGITFSIYYKKDLKTILGYIGKEGTNLLNEIFQFEPTKRPSCSRILNHPYFKLFKRHLINVIPFGIRKAMTVNKKKEYFSNNSRNNIIDNKYRIKYMANSDENNYISNDKQYGKISENKIIKQNINLKNIDKNINKCHKYNNSLNSDMRNTCKCFKNINYSNTKDGIDTKIKYIKMKRNENIYVSKKFLEYNNDNTEGSKECENYSPKYRYYKIPITKQGRNESKYFIINTRTKRMPFINKTIKEEKSFIDKSISRINDSSCLTLNESNNKKYNKNIIKKFKNRDIINNIYSTNINKYQMYSKKINNKNINILDEEPTFNKKNNINIDTNQKNINHINKRDKQRKNYKFFEVHENIKTNYNSHTSHIRRNVQNDSNHKICICPLGRNNIYNKNGLTNTNTIKSIHKITYNHAQKNLSYIKNKDNYDAKKIRLSPIKKNNIKLFGRPTSANKRKPDYCICDANGTNNIKKLNRKMLVSIVMTEDDKKEEPQLNYEKRKYCPYLSHRKL